MGGEEKRQKAQFTKKPEVNNLKDNYLIVFGSLTSRRLGQFVSLIR